jgi:speckle-type POZ protein
MARWPAGVVFDPISEWTLSDDLLRLLESKEGAEVTFQAAKSEFAAPTVVLAARSPVFHTIFAAHPRPQDEGASAVRRLVQNDDTGAATFGALLHFIYADGLPGIGGGGTSATRALGELLGAVNRYRLVRMRHLTVARRLTRMRGAQGAVFPSEI